MECEQNKAPCNEVFEAGDHAQAVLTYSLSLDKAYELPDANESTPTKKQLFSRHVVLTNHTASFFEIGTTRKGSGRRRSAGPRNQSPKRRSNANNNGLSFQSHFETKVVDT
jgi:hypothetical protein